MFAVLNTLDVDGCTAGMIHGVDYLTVDFGRGLHDYEILSIASSMEEAEREMKELFQLLPALKECVVIEGSVLPAPSMN